MDKRKLPITKHKIQLVAFTNDSMISLKPCQYNMSLASLQTKYHLLTALQRTEIMTLFLLLIHCCCCGEVEIGDQGSTGQHRNESEDCPDFLAIVDAADKGLYGRVPDPISISLSLSKLGLFSSAISIMPSIISKDVLITSIMLIHSQAVGIGQPRPFTTSDS